MYNRRTKLEHLDSNSQDNMKTNKKTFPPHCLFYVMQSHDKKCKSDQAYKPNRYILHVCWQRIFLKDYAYEKILIKISFVAYFEFWRKNSKQVVYVFPYAFFTGKNL